MKAVTGAAQTGGVPKPIAVRRLAEEVHRRGDIHLRFERGTTGAEGIATQKRVQANLPQSYLREHPVAYEFLVGEEPWQLRGRIDGCDPAAGLVEEYKTTRADIERLHEHAGHVHKAQLHLYAALLALEYPAVEYWQVDLCYCHPERDEVVERFSDRLSAAQLSEFLHNSIEVWRQKLLSLYHYRQLRNQRLAGLAFPFERFRPNQRALAGKVYTAFKSGTNLLLEAATGTGKSLATLYPAYKSLADTHLERIFFLTSRSTGQDAAQSAAEQLRASSLRGVTIIAREKACLVEGMPCDPDGCEYARGYFDRLPLAIAEGLDAAHNTPAEVQALAIKHVVCPFELSLDLSRWCDLVIMDYNYLFDPVVRVQRFEALPDAAILIDEAHQLDSRVRDMLSVSLALRDIKAVTASDSDAHESLKKKARTLARSFKHASKKHSMHSKTQPTGRAQEFHGDRPIEPPRAFTERVSEYVAAVTELGDEAFASEVVVALFFSALRWQRAQDWLDFDDSSGGDPSNNSRQNAAAFYDAPRNILKLVCLDPSEHIASTLAGYGPNAQFSGTFSPLPLYRHLHGDPEAELARVVSASQQDQLGLFVVPDVPTKYRSREGSLARLGQLVNRVISAREGNYFVAFPSFAYLGRFVEFFTEHYPQVALRVQQQGSDSGQREAFIEHFRCAAEPTLGVVVLGGVFTESLDFADDALLGVIVVSVALPPPDSAKDALVEFHAARGERDLGQIVAYRQPAMVRVVQAAGRVVRSETDRGVVCLVDSRFREAGFQALQPQHWQPEVVTSDQLGPTLDEFWRRG